MGQLLRSVYYKQVLIMRCFIVIICLGLILAVDGSARVRRDECEQLMTDHQNCAAEAYQTYTVEASKNDGRESFVARKSCNYMTAAVDTCGDKLVGNCYTQEQVEELKDDQIEKVMDQLKAAITEWDHEKCPPFKKYLERKKAKEDAANPPEPSTDPEPAAAPASGKQQSEDDKTNDGDNSGASTLVASALFSIILSL